MRAQAPKLEVRNLGTESSDEAAPPKQKPASPSQFKKGDLSPETRRKSVRKRLVEGRRVS
jgi:hypothetical protein